MREYIIKIDSDKPLPELIGENLIAFIKITGDCDEIIRCKDCVWYDGKYCSAWDDGSVAVECETDRDGFCHRATRKQE